MRSEIRERGDEGGKEGRRDWRSRVEERSWRLVSGWNVGFDALRDGTGRKVGGGVEVDAGSGGVGGIETSELALRIPSLPNPISLPIPAPTAPIPIPTAPIPLPTAPIPLAIPVPDALIPLPIPFPRAPIPLPTAPIPLLMLLSPMLSIPAPSVEPRTSIEEVNPDPTLVIPPIE